MIAGNAIVFTDGILDTTNAKTCHGLLRGGSRFNILGVIDSVNYGRDAGEVMDVKPIGIHVFKSVNEFFKQSPQKPVYFIVGVAFAGGQLPESCRSEIIQAMKKGMSIVCGLHQFLSDDVEYQRVAKENGVDLIDIRKPLPPGKLRFWSGDIYSVKTPKIAVLGTDCAAGKRTTCTLLSEACNNHGIKTEMIYTGQTGWMQGYKHGFIFDATANDFIGGEIEKAIMECDKESFPDLILIEGQSSLRNPSGPCGSEFLLSGNVNGVILHHVPSRTHFIDFETLGCAIPPIEDEINLIRMYGADTLVVTLSEEGWENQKMRAYRDQLAEKLSIPVIRPLTDGVEGLIPIILEFMKRNSSSGR
ncbi:MAG: DUF1611 domain-containing protein [Bacteroidales bacterium]|nr:DUF1611 domain-containing protein [Bacteroidales bacterium]